VFADGASERRAACQVPLARLGLTPKEAEPLEQLAVTRLGHLLRLPAEGLISRFGTRLYRLHRLAAGALADPLAPEPERLPVEDLLFVEPAESDAARLLFLVKGRLPFLLDRLAARQQALHTLHLDLRLDDRTRHALAIRPAQPTRDERLILELLRLRLERLRLRMGVTEIAFAVEARGRGYEQLSLLPHGRKRDLAAANHALAQLRAEYGEQAVLHAVPREAHLPEARFAWEPLEALDWPRPPTVTAAAPAGGTPPGAPPGSQQQGARPTLVRRLLARPAPLPGWPREPAQWRADRSPSADALVGLHGPFAVSGGWWSREQARDYYLAESRTGRMLWVYQDRRRGRWFHQGWVE
jgi:protein ImuB